MSLKQSLATKQICKTMNLGKTMAAPLKFTRLCRAQSALKKNAILKAKSLLKIENNYFSLPSLHQFSPFSCPKRE